MKIALLVCDEPNRSFKHDFDSYSEMFVSLFEEIDKDISLVPFDVYKGEFPKEINAFSGYLSTGSANSVYENKTWILDLKLFLQKLYTNKSKYFGICFGHQMIAYALGGIVEKAKEDWMIGVKETEILKKQNWMSLDLDFCQAISSHQDQIIKLPPETEVIGRYDGCAYAMIKVGEHFIGFQGHPEFKKEYALPLAESRSDRIDGKIIEKAKASFGMEPDSRELATWIYQFFKADK